MKGAFVSAAVTQDQELFGVRPRWSNTCCRLHADKKRLLQTVGEQKLISLHPSYICVYLYRMANYLHRRGHNLLARAVWQVNFLLTGADVSPAAEIGEGLLILSPAGISLMGRAGRNLTVMPCAGFGGEMGTFDDVGAGPGLPWLGDDVILEPHSGILGAIRVGHRVRVCAGVVLTKPSPDDTVVEGPVPRFLSRRVSP